MANPIVPKKSAVTGKVPKASDLALGEIAINHADRILFSRHPSTGDVITIAGTEGLDQPSADARYFQLTADIDGGTYAGA